MKKLAEIIEEKFPDEKVLWSGTARKKEGILPMTSYNLLDVALSDKKFYLRKISEKQDRSFRIALGLLFLTVFGIVLYINSMLITPLNFFILMFFTLPIIFGYIFYLVLRSKLYIASNETIDSYDPKSRRLYLKGLIDPFLAYGIGSNYPLYDLDPWGGLESVLIKLKINQHTPSEEEYKGSFRNYIILAFFCLFVIILWFYLKSRLPS